MLILQFYQFKKLMRLATHNLQPEFSEKINSFLEDVEALFYHWGGVISNDPSSLTKIKQLTIQFIAKLKNKKSGASNLDWSSLVTKCLSLTYDPLSTPPSFTKEEMLGAKWFYAKFVEPLVSEENPNLCLKKVIHLFNEERIQRRLPYSDTLLELENITFSLIKLNELSGKDNGFKKLLDKEIITKNDFDILYKRNLDELTSEFLEKKTVLDQIMDLSSLLGINMTRALLLKIFNNKHTSLNNLLPLMYKATQFMDSLWQGQKAEKDSSGKGDSGGAGNGNGENKENVELLGYIDLVSKHPVNASTQARFDVTLADYMSALYRRKFPEKPLDVVMKEFREKSQDVQFPLVNEELDKIKAQYLKIKEYEPIFGLMNQDQLKDKQQAFCKMLHQNPRDENAMIGMLALIREQVKRTFGLFPYNVQMLNVLAFLNSGSKRRLAQIKTGEGKSLTVAMLAAFLAQTKPVDIAMPSAALSDRDAEKFKPLYEKLGLTVGAMGKGVKTKLDIYKKNIVYSPIYELEETYLFTGTDSGQGSFITLAITGGDTTRITRCGRKYGVMIVDEVDNMFLDTQDNPLKTTSKYARCNPKVYKHIHQYMSSPEAIQTPEAVQKVVFEKMKEKISVHRAKILLNSYRCAQELVEDKNYIIRDKKVLIVDYEHTGAIWTDTHWAQGLHEFVEVKHGLEAGIEKTDNGLIAHTDYFNLYEELYGLTGTLGTEDDRKELYELYQVSTYDCPPYKASQKQPEPHISSSTNQKLEEITKDTQEKLTSGRPVLIICESIKESILIHEHINKTLKDKFKCLQLYNAVQEESVEKIISMAGSPGTITIATNTAGRGTDIVISAEAAKNKGLHVIVCFPTINPRVEIQAFGRTGRQGNPGTYRYIMNRSDLLNYIHSRSRVVVSGMETCDDHQIFNVWFGIRSFFNTFDSKHRQLKRHLRYLTFQIQQMFFSLPPKLKQEKMAFWSIFFTDLDEKFDELIYNLPFNYNDPQQNEQASALLKKQAFDVFNAGLELFCKKIGIGTPSIEFGTPLHLAVLQKDKRLMDFILEYRPQWFYVKDKEGKTAIDLAQAIDWVPSSLSRVMLNPSQAKPLVFSIQDYFDEASIEKVINEQNEKTDKQNENADKQDQSEQTKEQAIPDKNEKSALTL